MHLPRAMQLTRATNCMLCMHSVRTTHYTHVPHSSFQVDCTHGMHCTQAANGHRVRVHCTQRICPGRDISTSTRSDLHPRSDTAFLPHRTSGRALQRNENTSICRTQPIHTGTARSTRNACTRCGQRGSRRSQGDITGLFDLHSKRSTSANCGMKL